MGLTKVTYAMIDGASVNVLDYGAVGDGTTDDTVAIQAALNSGANIVYLPAGDYAISTQIVVPSNVWLQGAGKGATTIKPFNAANHQHQLIVNYMASQTSGTTLDENITISDLTLNGLSTGTANDGRLGYGIEIYGAQNVHIHDIEIINMPLSGIEICGDKAANAFGVRAAPYGTSVPPLKCIDVVVERIILNHVGWQERYLEAPTPITTLYLWGDSGFGVIARAPARNVVIRDVFGTDVCFGIAGVGQLVNKNDSAKTGDNLAQVIGAVIENCFADQTGFSPDAPTFRAAFCRNVQLINLNAKGNSTSTGIACRQAGTTWVQNVSIVNCVTTENNYGLVINGANDAGILCENISVVGGQHYANTIDGVLIEDVSVNISNIISFLNGRHGISISADVSVTNQNCNVSNSIAKNNGTITASSSGIRLNNTSKCTISACQAFDNQVSHTQYNGISEIGTSNGNVIVSCTAYGNTNDQISLTGYDTIAAANIGGGAAVSTATIASGAITAPVGFATRFLDIDTEGSAATDDLDTINGGTTGQILIFRSATGTRETTFKDRTGNLRLASDFTLATVNDTITLICDSTVWKEIARSNNG